MDKTEWILCPLCGSKTRNKVREDTVLINYPLYCPKCRQETLIEAKNLQVIVIKEPDTLDQAFQPHGFLIQDTDILLFFLLRRIVFF